MSRCPFLSRATPTHINCCSDKLLNSIALKCPVAKNVVTSGDSLCSVLEAKFGDDFKKFNQCKHRTQCQKKFKQIAFKCCNKKPASCPFSISIDHTKEPLLDEAKAALELKKKTSTYRIFQNVQRQASNPSKSIIKNNSVINWSSNDYLGQSTHPEVLKTTKNIIDKNGVGAGGTRNISGNSVHHHELENRLARWHNQEKALLFSSCYVANVNAISQICNLSAQNRKKIVLISDQNNHRSIIEGISDGYRKNPEFVTKKIFKHNDLEHLQSILENVDCDATPLIIFESIYSMEGDKAPIQKIINLAKKFNALTFCDEVHAIGLYGQNGHGFCDDQIDFISGTLGKAVGSIGGYIAANSTMIEYFRLHCPGFIFTTSLPPALVAAASKSIEILSSKQGHLMRRKQVENVNLMKNKLLNYYPDHVEIFSKSNHIIPLFINDSEKATKIQNEMIKLGHYVTAINSPTVPEGSERLRIVVTPNHCEDDINLFVSDLVRIDREICDDIIYNENVVNFEKMIGKIAVNKSFEPRIDWNLMLKNEQLR